MKEAKVSMSSECYENRNRGSCDCDPVNSEGQMFLRSQSVVSRVVAGETLIVPIRGRVGDLASIYSFNGTGTLIWKFLEAPATIGELVEAVLREFAVEHARAEQDVRQFVREMISVGLVDVPTPVAAGGTEGRVGRAGLAAADAM
jgi:Coenzyme PQQ synthesis protein D (PqqD)